MKSPWVNSVCKKQWKVAATDGEQLLEPQDMIYGWQHSNGCLLCTESADESKEPWKQQNTENVTAAWRIKHNIIYVIFCPP